MCCAGLVCVFEQCFLGALRFSRAHVLVHDLCLHAEAKCVCVCVFLKCVYSQVAQSIALASVFMSFR